jgi:hypothetical protein
MARQRKETDVEAMLVQRMVRTCIRAGVTPDFVGPLDFAGRFRSAVASGGSAWGATASRAVARAFARGRRGRWRDVTAVRRGHVGRDGAGAGLYRRRVGCGGTGHKGRPGTLAGRALVKPRREDTRGVERGLHVFQPLPTGSRITADGGWSHVTCSVDLAVPLLFVRRGDCIRDTFDFAAMRAQRMFFLSSKSSSGASTLPLDHIRCYRIAAVRPTRLHSHSHLKGGWRSI